VLAYDARHCLHCPRAGLPFKPSNYLELCHEIPERAEYLWAELHRKGLVDQWRCISQFVPATTLELTCAAAGGPSDNDLPYFQTETVHTEDHVAEGSIQYADPASYIVDGSETAAKLAVGGLLAVTRVVCTREMDNGFAIIRPPGHHATNSCCVSGFCLYNNVAVAAANCRLASWLQRPQEACPQRIAIVDFDVHHGDGVQNTFYAESNVLYVSIHRGAFDSTGKETLEKGGRGNGFFPGTGYAAEVGKGPGLGKNVNIPFESEGHDDASYILAFNWIILPILRQFNPDVVFVCAGFDAAVGDKKSQANFQVTKHCYGWMTTQLLAITPHVIMALEGGYDIESIAEGGTECILALLHGSGSRASSLSTVPALPRPNSEAISTVQKVAEIQGHFWTLPTEKEALMLHRW
jgi:histone deacetylase 6